MENKGQLMDTLDHHRRDMNAYVNYLTKKVNQEVYKEVQ